MSKFTLTIRLGNDAMQTLEDVAEVLHTVQNGLERGDSTGRVFDYNGNAVGEWEVVK